MRATARWRIAAVFFGWIRVRKFVGSIPSFLRAGYGLPRLSARHFQGAEKLDYVHK